jgi:glycosyltransferase involved in cell wall biosynthesis
MKPRVVFVGGARYDQPLDATSEKKFRAMKPIAELFVIGFSQDLRLRRFTEHAHFYLLPQLPLPILRYLEVLVLGQILILWLIVRHGIQLVVTQDPYAGFVAALAIKFIVWLGYRVRLVVEVHGDFERALFLQRDIQFPRLYCFLMNHVARYSLKHADLLRAISIATKEQLMQWAPDKTIVQFPTWTDIETFLERGVQTQKDISQTILYVGALTPLKGIHHLINAFARIEAEFPRAQLIIIGKEESRPYAQILTKQVLKYELQDRVRFVDAMPQATLAKWMAHSAVLVLPSLSEGLGRVIIEAMATGTPVIGSRVGGIPEMVQDGTTGFLVPPSDEEKLADKISWILQNPDSACAMGTYARAFAHEFFSTDAFVRGYKQIVDRSKT